MPAEIDSMFYYGQMPWHRQGTRLDEPATAEEAMQAAGLDWEVQKQPLYTGPNKDVKVKDRYAVCRTDRLDQEGGGQLPGAIVGRDFVPLQNAEAFSFLDPVADRKEVFYHTAGALQGGRRVWLLAKLPGHIRVVGDDVVEKYILLSNAHDGTAAVRVGLSGVRVVCLNTLTLALRGMSGVSIRHRRGVAERVREAHKMLGLVNEAYDRAEWTMRRMAAEPMNEQRLREYFHSVLPLPREDAKQRKRVVQRHKRFRELFETGDGNDRPEARGSLWAAYNAVTQWADRESYTKRHKEPLRRILFGDAAHLKRQAYEVAAGFAGVSEN